MAVVKPLTIDFSVVTIIAFSLYINFNVNITTIIGTVMDNVGAPIPYGRLHLYYKYGPAEVLESNANGRFVITGIEGDEVTVVMADSSYDRKINFPVLDAGETTIEILNIATPDEDDAERWRFPSIIFRP